MTRVRTAERSKVKLKLCLSGLSGSGKTYSALKLAYGITGAWEKVALLDSENGSGELYSNLGPYKYLDLRYNTKGALADDPHSPENYTAAIKELQASGADVIIVDSLSHEWDGIGGVLDSVERLGGRFSDWPKVNPRHKRFLDALLFTPCHIIGTLRRKSDYQISEEERGGKLRQKIEKVGLKAVQREGLEYEFTTQFTIDLRHLAAAEKDRTGLFSGRTPFKIDEGTGRSLVEWANSGRDERAREDHASTREDSSLKTLIYKGEDSEKKGFADVAKSFGIVAQKDLLALSNACVGTPTIGLKEKIDQLLNEGTLGL